jgi:hypothetical protein
LSIFNAEITNQILTIANKKFEHEFSANDLNISPNTVLNEPNNYVTGTRHFCIKIQGQNYLAGLIADDTSAPNAIVYVNLHIKLVGQSDSMVYTSAIYKATNPTDAFKIASVKDVGYNYDSSK